MRQSSPYSGSSSGERACYSSAPLLCITIRPVDNVVVFWTTQALEAIIWAHLRHKNILPFYGVFLFGHMSPRLSLVSPWMEQGNLSDYLRRNPKISRIGFVGITNISNNSLLYVFYLLDL